MGLRRWLLGVLFCFFSMLFWGVFFGYVLLRPILLRPGAT